MKSSTLMSPSRPSRPLRLRSFLPYLVISFLTIYVTGTFWFMSQVSSGQFRSVVEPRGLLRLENISPGMWTVDDVGLWLMVIGFPQYRKSFASRSIDGPKLLEVDKAQLEKELNVHSFLDAHRLLKLVEKLKGQERFELAGLGVHEVSLYYTGDDVNLPPPHKLMSHKTADLLELLKLSTELFEENVVRLVDVKGNDLYHGDPVPDKLFALMEGQYFVYPLQVIGHKQQYFDKIEDKMFELKTISRSPRVFEIEGFLNEGDCNEVIRWGVGRMDPSTVAQAHAFSQNVRDEVRTSSTAWVTESTPLFDKIAQRVADLAKIPKDNAEDMQILRYEYNQHYYAHHDYFDPKAYPDPIYKKVNRFVTVLFYLSDGFEGGETIFPYASGMRPDIEFSDCSVGMKVVPKKGSALLFYSLQARSHQHVEVDPMSLHGSCDVKTQNATKWAANYWIRNRRWR